MRVIGGEFKNKRVQAPKGQDIRPTGERVREAIFNILYTKLDLSELTVADICCGTGALGIEAISRGAQHCTFVDLDIKPVVHNLKEFEIEDKSKVIRSLGQKVKLMKPVDLIFVDPPYYQEIADTIIKNARNIGKPGSMWIVEVEKKHELLFSEDEFELLDNRRYGHSRIYILEQK